MIKELDCVVLQVDLPEEGLARGNIGTVVHAHGGGDAFIVEFIDSGGDTVAVIDLVPSQVRLAMPEDFARSNARAAS